MTPKARIRSRRPGCRAFTGEEFLELASEQGFGAPATDRMPLVVMMDSSHPSRVYDEKIRARNGTNADMISDILLDLPLRRQKEAIGPPWHHDEEVLLWRRGAIIRYRAL